jgi:hypothetical protein
MDTQAQEQQQKEFLSSFFPADVSVDELQRSLDSNHGNNGLFSFNGTAASHLGISSSHSGLGNGANARLDMELLGNLMAMQGIEGQPGPNHQHPQYTPQLLLEQQFKLTQLQQLQQLQHQIFQQQVSLLVTRYRPGGRRLYLDMRYL